MTGPVASQLLKMLRAKVPAEKILRLAIHEYEGMEAALKFVTTAKLGASARALRVRVQAALKYFTSTYTRRRCTALLPR
jgi:hypothetical protein